jgi:hypothetical protein
MTHADNLKNTQKQREGGSQDDVTRHNQGGRTMTKKSLTLAEIMAITHRRLLFIEQHTENLQHPKALASEEFYSCYKIMLMFFEEDMDIEAEEQMQALAAICDRIDKKERALAAA